MQTFVYDTYSAELRLTFTYEVREPDGLFHRVVFPPSLSLSEMCCAVYHRWGQASVLDFVDHYWGDVVKYAYCEPCEFMSPVEDTDPDNCCLVCGSMGAGSTPAPAESSA